MIKFLLKNKGMTINGVKNLINLKINKLDYSNDDSLKAEYYKNLLKTKSKLLSEKIKKIRKYGKKLILKFVWFLKAILIVNLFTMRKNLLKVKKLKKN